MLVLFSSSLHEIHVGNSRYNYIYPEIEFDVQISTNHKKNDILANW